MRVVWFPAGSEDKASSRLRCWKLVPHLRLLGHEISVRGNTLDFQPEDFDVVVIQKRHDLRQKMKVWKRQTAVVYDVDDLECRIEPAHLVTVGSVELASRISGSIHIPCSLDITNGGMLPEVNHREVLSTVCWFGLFCNAYHARPVYLACQKLGLTLRMIVDVENIEEKLWPGVEYRQWTLDTIDQDIVECDVVVCPYVFGEGRWSDEWTHCKNANRLLKAWALKVPVIGTPIRDYVEVGLVHKAFSVDEWVEQLEIMRSLEVRLQDVRNGFLIASQFTSDIIASVWESTLLKLLEGRTKNGRERH